MKIARNHTGHRVGECHPMARLTDEQVREMRKLRKEKGTSYGVLAGLFDCSESCVRDIITLRTRSSA